MHSVFAVALLGVVAAQEESFYQMWWDINVPAPTGHSNVSHGFEFNDPKGLLANKGHQKQSERDNGNGQSITANEFILGNALADELQYIRDTYEYDIIRHEGVVTIDQYNLELWRMADKDDDPPKTAHPMILCHGAGQNGLAWMNNGEDSVAFQLFEAGYDVWIMNDRMSGVQQTLSGNKTNAQVENRATFWDAMSFVEVGKYDMPAVAQYILDDSAVNTNRNENFSEKVTFITHSTAAASFLSALAEERANFYNGNTTTNVPAKLNSLVALSPMVRMNNLGDELNHISKWVYQMREYREDNDMNYVNFDGEIVYDDGSTGTIAEQFWTDYASNSATAFSLDALAELIYEWRDAFFDPGYQRYDTHPVDFEMTAWFPFRNMEIMSQMNREQEFQDLNKMSEVANQVIYDGSSDPGLFPVEEIPDTIPIYFVYAEKDRLVREEDIEWLEDTFTWAEWKLIDGGHATPLQAQDMTYFSAVKTFIAANLPVQA